MCQTRPQNQFRKNYIKGAAMKSWFGPLLGDGIFVSDGTLWKLHRKLAVKFFSKNMLRESARMTKQNLFKMVDVLDEKLQASKEGIINLDIQDMFFRLTVDTTSEMLFGVDLQSIQRDGTQHEFALAFDRAQYLCFEALTNPFSSLFYKLRLTSDARELRRCVRTVDKFTGSVIQNLKHNAIKTKDGNYVGKDLISRYLQSAKDDHVDEPSDKEIRDMVVNFLLAGRDTTASALSWAMYELCKHPKVVQRIIQEVREKCGISGDIADELDLSHDMMGKLKYTHAVVLEVLRLHPSVAYSDRFAVQDDTLPDGTFVPKGAMIMIMPYAMGRYESRWGSDYLEFKPERFLRLDAEPSPFRYPVFWAGPRGCIGQSMAVATMKMALAVLLSEYEFIDKEGHSGEYHVAMVAPMKGGFPVQVQRRVKRG